MLSISNTYGTLYLLDGDDRELAQHFRLLSYHHQHLKLCIVGRTDTLHSCGERGGHECAMATTDGGPGDDRAAVII